MPKSKAPQETARSRGLRGWAVGEAFHSEKGVYRIHVSDPAVAPIGAGFELPRAFTIEPTDETRPVFDIEVRDELAVCVGVRAREGSRLTTVSVRQPIDAFVKSAIYVLAIERTEAPTQDRVLGAEIESGVTVHAHRLRHRPDFEQLVSERRRGRRIPDEWLHKVADVYRRADARGQPPTEAVFQELPVSRSTAGRQVMEARRRGFLPPTEPRKARSH